MRSPVLQFVFAGDVEIIDAEATLHLAILAAEGLFGESRVRMDVAYFIDRTRRVIHLDTGSIPGDAVARIFTVFAAREFADGSFTVVRVRATPPGAHTPAGAAA